MGRELNNEARCCQGPSSEQVLAGSAFHFPIRKNVPCEFENRFLKHFCRSGFKKHPKHYLLCHYSEMALPDHLAS